MPAGMTGGEAGVSLALRDRFCLIRRGLVSLAGIPLLAAPSSLHLKAVPTPWAGAEKCGLASISPSDLLFGK